MNIGTPTEAMLSDPAVCLLEKNFPHIAKGLIEAWQDPDRAERYLNTILLDDRVGRQGFPQEAFDELVFLSDLNWMRRHFDLDGVEVTAEGFSFGRP
jgi:hypothetical protein